MGCVGVVALTSSRLVVGEEVVESKRLFRHWQRAAVSSSTKSALVAIGMETKGQCIGRVSCA